MRLCVRYDNQYVLGITFPMLKCFYIMSRLDKNEGEMKNDRMFQTPDKFIQIIEVCAWS